MAYYAPGSLLGMSHNHMKELADLKCQLLTWNLEDC